MVDTEVIDMKDIFIPQIFVEGFRTGHHGEAHLPRGRARQYLNTYGIKVMSSELINV